MKTAYGKKGAAILIAAAIFVASVAGGAFASSVNPFMDVPMGHWSYDAIAQLGARGIISGYPDGTFKGAQPMTRYEAASVVARSLAIVDMSKADKQDVEMLKRLVIEFKDELDKLGVRLGELDQRIAVIENDLGGWSLKGEFRMDGKFADKDAGLYTQSGKSDFEMSRMRIWMSKRVDDKVTFTTRFGLNSEFDAVTGENKDNILMDLAWLDIHLPWDVDMKVGKWQVDWSAADGTYGDNDSMFSDRILKGFYFSRQWGSGETSAYVSRDDDNRAGAADETLEYGLRGKVHVNENLWASANFIKRQYDGNRNVDLDESVLWGTVGANVAGGVEGRASYYSQKLGADVQDVSFGTTDSPDAWQLSLAVDQAKLGNFSSFRVEYLKPDENFRAWTDGPWDMYGAKVTGKELGRYDSVLFLSAEQKWNNTWTTFERYLKGSARWNALPGGALADDTTNWTVGVRHNYTPALSFELAYDKIENSETLSNNSDHMVRFRTNIAF